MFCNTWQLGGPSLQPALEKLLGTWVGVFPQPVLNDVHARLAQMRAAVPLQQQQQQQPNGYGGPFASYGGQPMDQYAQQQPMRMMQDPRLAPGGQYPQLPPQQQPMYGMQQQQQAPPYYGPPGQAPVAQPSPGYGAPYSTLPPQQPAPAYGYAHQAPGQPQPLYPQPQQAYSQTVQGGALAAGAGLQQQQLPDLLSSLVNAGLLLSTAAPGAAAAVQPAGSLPTTPPHAVTASPTPEQSSLEFSPDRIKVQDLRTQLCAPRPLPWMAPAIPVVLFACASCMCSCPVTPLHVPWLCFEPSSTAGVPLGAMPAHADHDPEAMPRESMLGQSALCIVVALLLRNPVRAAIQEPLIVAERQAGRCQTSMAAKSGAAAVCHTSYPAGPALAGC